MLHTLLNGNHQREHLYIFVLSLDTRPHLGSTFHLPPLTGSHSLTVDPRVPKFSFSRKTC